jgi:outer membrane protein OmpA-like peptidoglycan-associated protein
MKAAHAAVFLAIGALVVGCATQAPLGGPSKRVSADYEAIGETFGMKAFVYGKRTVLEYPNTTAWISIRDAEGVPVPFEREGRYVRLSRQLDRFSVWSYSKAVTFTAIARPSNVPATQEGSLASAEAVPLRPVKVQAIAAEDDNARFDALVHLVSQQLDELRRDIKEQHYSPSEAKSLSARLDRIEAKLADSTATVQVQFEFGKADFKPSPDVGKVLVEAAKLADLVNVRGRTDSVVAGPSDARLARLRAAAAKDYLVAQGVDGAKIKVYSLASGDFTASTSTSQGRAKNRRVDIEFVGGQALRLKTPAIAVAVATQ